jgi:hypothetical protein
MAYPFLAAPALPALEASSSVTGRLIVKFMLNSDRRRLFTSLALISTSCGEVGVLHQRRALQVAHELGHARVRLGVAGEIDLQSLLLDALQVHPVGRLAHQLVEQVDGARAVGLQRLDDLLAREQRADLVAQLADLGDLLVELLVFGLEERVAFVLRRDVPGDHAVDGPGDHQTENRESDGEDPQLPAVRLAPLLTVRQ